MFLQAWSDVTQIQLGNNAMIAHSSSDFQSKVEHLLTRDKVSGISSLLNDAIGALPIDIEMFSSNKAALVIMKCLLHQRDSSALFDLPQFVRNFEAGLLLVWARYQEQLPTDHLVVLERKQ